MLGGPAAHGGPEVMAGATDYPADAASAGMACYNRVRAASLLATRARGQTWIGGSTMSSVARGQRVLIDMIGWKYGLVTVVGRADNIGSSAAWHCECACGNRWIILGKQLRSQGIKSCGCARGGGRTVLSTLPPPGARLIPLTKGKCAIVDEADYEAINAHKWYTMSIRRSEICYAARHVRESGKRITLLMHAVIAGTSKGQVTDHRDGDGLNNRRNNLRVCTQAENSRNIRNRNPDAKTSSIYKGVYFCRGNQSKPWVARVGSCPKTKKHLGYFASEVDAAKAYDIAAIERFGEFAVPNFSDEIRAGLAEVLKLPESER